MKKNYGVVIPDENLFTSVQKITFSNGAYGFYVETGLGCALVFPSGKAVYDVWFKNKHFKEACAAEDIAYVLFRDGRIYDAASEWVDLQNICDEWAHLESLFLIDPSEPFFVERLEFESALARFQKTIFYEPRASYAAFVPVVDFLACKKN